jgi:hypothetical protein
MAGGQSKVGPRQERLQAAGGQLGDWIGLIIAFVVVSGMSLAVSAVFFGSAE